MHNRHDQLAKNLLRDALVRASAAETEVEVSAATQKIDVWCVPDPERKAERIQLGELGKLSAESSLFEPFSGTPNIDRVRDCLRKQLTWHHELKRRVLAVARAAATKGDPEENDQEAEPKEAVREKEPGKAVPFPVLVIISRGRPKTVLEAYTCQKVRQGIYHAAWGLNLRIVVLSELPRTQETLLLRLLGSGSVLRDALRDLLALPDDAWEKGIATPLLLHFQFEIEESSTSQEDDVSPEIQAWYEDYQQKQQKLRAEARTEASVETQAGDVLTVLRVRGIAVPDSARSQILDQKDPERLKHWLERAALAASVAEVIDEPS